MSSGKDYDYASEEIRNALVEEYLRLHPDVKEQDVMLACIDGKLVFTHVAAVLSDLRVRKKFSQCLMQGKRLFSELAIHHDKRWRECMDSTSIPNRWWIACIPLILTFSMTINGTNSICS